MKKLAVVAAFAVLTVVGTIGFTTSAKADYVPLPPECTVYVDQDTAHAPHFVVGTCNPYTVNGITLNAIDTRHL